MFKRTIKYCKEVIVDTCAFDALVQFLTTIYHEKLHIGTTGNREPGAKFWHM